MNVFERPAPDLDKISDAWQRWTSGAEDALPGRTMADLKIGGIDTVLQALASDSEPVAAVAEVWNAWERGKVGPTETLSQLTGMGFDDIISALGESP